MPPSRPDRRTPRLVYRRFLAQGWSPAAAGNITGWLVGLRPTATGWTPDTIEALVRTRRVGGSAD